MNILIAGAGAIGSNLTRNLVADLRGEHKITVLDQDVVEERNVTAGTQFYTPDQVGQPKVEALQFNMYKWFEREVDIIHGELGKVMIPDAMKWQLLIDCFDNYDARDSIQRLWELGKQFEQMRNQRYDLLHIGFSDQFTFEIEWATNYQVPTDIASGFDICEMPGASAFVTSVASLGALVVEQYCNQNEKLSIVGGKFTHSLIK